MRGHNGTTRGLLLKKQAKHENVSLNATVVHFLEDTRFVISSKLTTPPSLLFSFPCAMGDRL